MKNSTLKNLKSGTDIRGTALEINPNEKIDLDDLTVQKIAYGFLIWLKNNVDKEFKDLKISIGHDSRLSSNRLKNFFIKTLTKFGISVLDCGLSSTPAMFMTIIDLKCDASVEITASHHPFNKNGFKFFTKKGGLNSQDIDSILDFANSYEEDITFPKNVGKITEVNYMREYAKRLRNLICEKINSKEYDLPLKNLKIVVDAGNGAGGFFATNVLKVLGADITGSQFLNPDGRFPNHIPNPEDKIAIKSIKEATLKNKADLGIIFDTDVDRVGAIDCLGQEINRNNLIAIASKISFENQENAVVVTDSVTSNGLKKYIEKDLKGKQLRYKRGYKNVINKAIHLNELGINCPLAIETSGHAAMRENYFLDDGAYLITKMIILLVNLKKQNKNFYDILKNVPQPKESIEYRLKINTKDSKDYADKIINCFETFSKNYKNWVKANDSKEGIKFDIDENGKKSWILIRKSVHDPILVINIESDIENYSSKLKNILNLFLKDFKFIDKIK